MGLLVVVHKSVGGRDLPRHGVALEGDGLTWDVGYLDRPMYGKVEAVWTNFRNPVGNVVSAGDGEPAYRMRHPFAGEGETRLPPRRCSTSSSAPLPTLPFRCRGVRKSAPGTIDVQAVKLVAGYRARCGRSKDSRLLRAYP